MKIKYLKSFIMAGFIGLSPVNASLMQFMGGGQEPEDENAMNFPHFFDTVNADFEFSRDIKFHPQENSGKDARKISFSVTIVASGALERPREKAKKKLSSDDLAFAWHENDGLSWLTPKSLKKCRASLPSIVINPSVSKLYDNFLEYLINEKVGADLLLSHEEKITFSFFNSTLRQGARPSDFFEEEGGSQLKKRKRSEDDQPHVDIDRQLKSQKLSLDNDDYVPSDALVCDRPQFTRKTVLDQIYKTEKDQDRARKELCKVVFTKNYECSRLFYYDKGFVILRLTSEDDARSEDSAAPSHFFNRTPTDQEDILDSFEEWMKAECNLLYKTLVVDENKGQMYT